MKKQHPEEEKTDLKHDSMEFSAASDGNDQLDTDDMAYEEEGISAEELDFIEDVPDNEAAALNAVETDLEADEDLLPEEEWEEDTKDEEDGESGELNHHRI